MASDKGSSSTNIVAIVAIVLMVLIGGLVAYKMGVFGGGDGDGKGKIIDVDIKK